MIWVTVLVLVLEWGLVVWGNYWMGLLVKMATAHSVVVVAAVFFAVVHFFVDEGIVAGSFRIKNS